MEKSRPTFALAEIQQEFRSESHLRMTRSSRNSAFALGMSLSDVIALIQSTSRDADGHVVVSLKEK
ncbi:MAG TPA: hypothetical protein PKW35_17265 [Nannocystaceae bacterium]|nr:hypothetical protein [Nannocystaceae bacterium]